MDFFLQNINMLLEEIALSDQKQHESKTNKIKLNDSRNYGEKRKN